MYKVKMIQSCGATIEEAQQAVSIVIDESIKLILTIVTHSLILEIMLLSQMYN